MSLRVGLALVCLTVTCRTYDVTYTQDGGPCPPPSTTCAGLCVDTNSDRANCGACGIACTDKQLCTVGACVACSLSSQTVCGINGAAFCTDLASDNQNCGQCQNKCAHGEQCVSSTCACTLTSCPSDAGLQCVDTQSDINHCGGCTTTCPSPGPNETPICNAGNCSQQCISPFADCDGISSNGCEANLQTSSTNCGACGRSCNGGACVSGMCPVTTYTSGTKLTGLAVDTSFVYWADDSSTGSISQAPIGGGAAQLVYATTTASSLGVDQTRIVWLQSSGTELDSRLLTGGAVTSLASLASGMVMSLSGGFVYYTTTDGKVWRAPEDGSVGPNIITQGAFGSTSLTVDATNVYFADGSSTIYSAPVTATNTSKTVFANASAAVNLANDAANVYWTTATNFVVAQGKASSTSKTLASGQLQPGAIATDGLNVYWSSSDGSIHRVSVTGGTPLTLSSKGTSPSTNVAVDGTNVYWTSTTAVQSTPK